MDTTASTIAHTIYRDFLEKSLEAGQGKPNLLSLENDIDFCRAFVTRVLDPDFINKTLIVTYLSSSKAYPQAVAYLYERVRARLINGNDQYAFMSRRSAQFHWRPYAEKHADLLNANKVKPFLEKSLPVHWSVEEALEGPSFPLLGQRLSIQWRSSQDWVNLINEMINIVDKEPDRHTPVGTGRNPPTIINGGRTYGKDLQNWIKGKESQYPDIFTGVKPDNYEPGRPAGMLGCFVAGTQIRTTDGDVNIELLQNKTKVLTKAPGDYGMIHIPKQRWRTPTNRNARYFVGRKSATTYK